MDFSNDLVGGLISVVLGTITMLLWYKAWQEMTTSLALYRTPMFVLGTMFSLVLMLYPIAKVGGINGSLVGGVLVAIVFGPWVAVITTGMAVLLLTLLWGDGSIITVGMDVFNMAVIMPVVGYLVYRKCAGKTSVSSGWNAIAAGIGACIGFNVAFVLRLGEVGVQTMLSAYMGIAAVPELFVNIELVGCVVAVGSVEGIFTAAVMLLISRRQVSGNPWRRNKCW